MLQQYTTPRPEDFGGGGFTSYGRMTQPSGSLIAPPPQDFGSEFIGRPRRQEPGLLGKLARGMWDSVNFMEEGLPFRERLARGFSAATLVATPFIPALGAARFASLGAKVAMGAATNAGLMGVEQVIRGGPVVLPSLFAGALGGGLSGIGGLVGKGLTRAKALGSAPIGSTAAGVAADRALLDGVTQDISKLREHPFLTAMSDADIDHGAAMWWNSSPEAARKVALDNLGVDYGRKTPWTSAYRQGAKPFQKEIKLAWLEYMRPPRTGAASARSPMLHSEQWAILSAGVKGVAEDAHLARHAQMMEALSNAGYKPVTTRTNTGELALFVPGMTRKDALSLGSKFGQKEVLTNDGLFNLAENRLNRLNKGSTLLDDDIPSRAPWIELDVKGTKSRYHFGFNALSEPINPKLSLLPASTAAKLDAMVDESKHPWRKKLEAVMPWMKLDRLYTKSVRAANPIENFERKAIGLEPSTRKPLESPSKMFLQGLAYVSRTYSEWRHGIIDVADITKRSSKGAYDIFAKLDNEGLDTLERYGRAKGLLYRSLKNPHQFNILEHGFSGDAELQDFITQVERDAPEVAAAFQDFTEFRNLHRHKLVDAGVISEDFYQMVINANKENVPLHPALLELFAHADEEIPFTAVFNPVKKSQGIAPKQVSWVEQVVREMATTNKLIGEQQFFDALSADIAKVSEDVAEQFGFRRIAVKPPSISKAAKDVIEAVRLTDPDLAAALSFHDEELASLMAGGRKAPTGFVAGMKEGVRRWYEVTDPDMYQAISQLDPGSVGLVTQLLSGPRRLLQAGATLIDTFVIRNPVRDITFAAVTNDARAPMDFYHGIASTLLGDDKAKLFMAAGGGKSTLASLDRFHIRQMVHEALTGKPLLSPGTLVKHPVEATKAFADLMEQGTRHGAFMRKFQEKVDLGWSPNDAALEAGNHALDVTAPFIMHGSSEKARILRSTIAFWNAQLQSYDRLIRAFKENPVRATAKATAFITAPSIALYLHNRQDPEFKELPAWEKAVFWHLKVGGTWLRIPKPFELGLIFGSGVERLMEAIDESDPAALDAFAAKQVASNLGSLMPIPGRSALQPVAEVIANYSFFRQAPVESRGLEDVATEYRNNATTTEVAQYTSEVFGKYLGLSPMEIDHLIRGYGGGVGKALVADLPSMVIGAVKGEGRFLPTPTPQGTPFVRGFVSSFPAGAESVEQFYKLLDSTREATRTAQHLERSMEIDDQVDWMQEQAMKLGLAKSVENTSRRLSELRRARNIVLKDRSMPRDRQLATLRQLDDAMIAAAAAYSPFFRKEALNAQ